MLMIVICVSHQPTHNTSASSHLCHPIYVHGLITHTDGRTRNHTANENIVSRYSNDNFKLFPDVVASASMLSALPAESSMLCAERSSSLKKSIVLIFYVFSNLWIKCEITHHSIYDLVC